MRVAQANEMLASLTNRNTGTSVWICLMNMLAVVWSTFLLKCLGFVFVDFFFCYDCDF